MATYFFSGRRGGEGESQPIHKIFMWKNRHSMLQGREREGGFDCSPIPWLRKQSNPLFGSVTSPHHQLHCRSHYCTILLIRVRTICFRNFVHLLETCCIQNLVFAQFFLSLKAGSQRRGLVMFRNHTEEDNGGKALFLDHSDEDWSCFGTSNWNKEGRPISVGLKRNS